MWEAKKRLAGPHTVRNRWIPGQNAPIAPANGGKPLNTRPENVSDGLIFNRKIDHEDYIFRRRNF